MVEDSSKVDMSKLDEELAKELQKEFDKVKKKKALM
jgi:hypothetical protein